VATLFEKKCSTAVTALEKDLGVPVLAQLNQRTTTTVRTGTEWTAVELLLLLLHATSTTRSSSGRTGSYSLQHHGFAASLFFHLPARWACISRTCYTS